MEPKRYAHRKGILRHGKEPQRVGAVAVLSVRIVRGALAAEGESKACDDEIGARLPHRNRVLKPRLYRRGRRPILSLCSCYRG